MKLSIVTSLYNSEPYIKEFYERIVATAELVCDSFEIIIVDDGSKDKSATLIKSYIHKDSRIKLIELSRNFGHHQAFLAGLSEAKGELIFNIDIDLEEQPEWLEEFFAQYHQKKADVVYGVQTERSGGFLKTFFGSLFYKLFNFCSETKIPENPCTVRLMSKEYVEALVKIEDHNIFLAGLMSWTGFRQYAIPVTKIVRNSSSSYNVGRMLSLFVNAITSFSSYPLRAIFFIGIIISFIAFSIGVYMIIHKIITPDAIQLGWASLILSIWFLGGVIISFLGVIGIYLSKIFIETKNRPTYIIRKIYTLNNLISF